MKTFIITWDKLAYGPFPEDRVLNLIDNVSITVYTDGKFEQTVHFHAYEGDQFSGEDIFRFGMLVQSLISK